MVLQGVTWCSRVLHGVIGCNILAHGVLLCCFMLQGVQVYGVTQGFLLLYFVRG